MHLFQNCPLFDNGLNMSEYFFWDKWLNIGPSATSLSMPQPD
jgi:hypothetical protein